MARTRQTAKKSTGGIAPRKHIKPAAKSKKNQQPTKTPKVLLIVRPEPHPRVTPVSSDDEMDVSESVAPEVPHEEVKTVLDKEPDGLDWCYSCIDGGKLIVCDRCTRAMCTTRCLKFPENWRDVNDTVFICTSCHIDKYRKEPTPYFGLYIGPLKDRLDDMEKAFSDTPTIVTGPFALTMSGQMRLAPLVVIHFILKGIENKASPAIMVNEFLSAFFKDNGRLTYIEIDFDIDDVDDDDTSLNEHTDRMEKLAQTLLNLGASQCLTFVTTHGEDKRGDMFFSTKTSCTVSDFFETVIGNSVRDALKAMHTMAFLLVCGSLVNNPEPSAQLLNVAKDFEFDHLFAFTVDGLIPCLLSSLLIDIVHRTFIEGYDVTTYIGRILRSAPVVARHTAIVHIRRVLKTGDIESLKYIWANPDLRPYGNVLPLQCPKCFTFRPWAKRKQGRGEQANAYCFSCQGRWYDKKQKGIVYCDNIVVYQSQKCYTRVPDSDWYSLAWP